MDNKKNIDLSIEEYYILYAFFVTYSMCIKESKTKKNKVSEKARTITEYSPNNTDIYNLLKDTFKIRRNQNFITVTSINNLKDKANKLYLSDYIIDEFGYDKERAVFIKTNCQNKIYMFFHRIRNGLAHGRFKVILNSNNEKIIYLKDYNNNSCTAIIVIKLSTLLKIVRAIDKNNLIYNNYDKLINANKVNNKKEYQHSKI